MPTTEIYQDPHSVDNRSEPRDVRTRSSARPAARPPRTLRDGSVGELLEVGRLNKRWTVEELSARVKIPAATLVLYEASKVDPDVCAMHLLRHELNIDV